MCSSTRTCAWLLQHLLSRNHRAPHQHSADSRSPVLPYPYLYEQWSLFFMQYYSYGHCYLLIYLKGISTCVEIVQLFTAIFWISENGEKYNNEFPWPESLHSGEISHAYVRESKKRLYPDYPKVWRNCRAVSQGRAAYVVLCFSVSTWETCHRRCVCSGIEGMMTAGDRSTHCGMDCCSDRVLRRTLFSRFQICSHCLS